MIIEISNEQMDRLPGYRSKWQQCAMAQEPLHRPTVTEIIHAAYRLNGCPKPVLFFFDTPQQAIADLGLPTTRKPMFLASMLATSITKQVRAQFLPLLWTQLWRRSGYLYASRLSQTVSAVLINSIHDSIALPESIQQAVEVQAAMISDGALLDFCITVLGCEHTFPELWKIFTMLIQQCFWHMAFEDICVVVEQPMTSWSG